MTSHQGVTVCTCHYNFIVQCGAPQPGPGGGESSGGGPGGGGGEEELSAGQILDTDATGHQQDLQIIIIIIIICYHYH